MHNHELPQTPVDIPAGKEIATLASGCFWCTEAIFQQVKGVESVKSGYAGGHRPNPSYEQVCSESSGHAEALQIIFDPHVVSYHDLLVIFFTTHDPTTLNRQGADSGPQYRSAVFYHSSDQESAARDVIKNLDAEGIWPSPIVTEVTPFSNFYPAEEYHDSYFIRHTNQSYCQYVIAPKVAKFRQKYADRLKA